MATQFSAASPMLPAGGAGTVWGEQGLSPPSRTGLLAVVPGAPEMEFPAFPADTGIGILPALSLASAGEWSRGHEREDPWRVPHHSVLARSPHPSPRFLAFGTIVSEQA